MNEKELSLEELIDNETEARLNEMESADYDFPKRITKADVIFMAGSFAVSLGLIILCMLGVIK